MKYYNALYSVHEFLDEEHEDYDSYTIGVQAESNRKEIIMKSFQVRAYVKGGDMIVIHNCLYLIAPSAGDNTLAITVRDDNSGLHSVWIMGVVTFFVDAIDF